MCVCVCVFEIHVLKILNWETILRDYCVDWIISWVACWIAFMSVFFFSRKTSFKMWLDTSSIPSRHLAICQASQAFSYRKADSSSIPSGSIEKAPASSIASRHLVDQLSFYSWIWWIIARYLLDASAVDKHFLDTYLDSFLNTSFVELYWVFYLSLLVRSKPHFTRYPSWLLFVFSPKLFHLTPILIFKGFFKIFQDFLLLVSF